MYSIIARLSVALAGLAAVAALVGCDSSYPQPSEDAVYYFVANSRANGKMRVCWPEGQKYALAIAAADVNLQSQLGELRRLVGYEAEWPADDPRWRDAKAVAAHAEELEKLAGEGAEKRRDALEDLRNALDADLPEGLSLPDVAARQAFRQRLWDALDCEGETLEEHIARYENLLAQRSRLFAEEGDRGEWNSSVSAERERFFKYAAGRLREIAPAIANLDKQKQREEYNLLDNQRTYIRRRMENMERELRELIRDEHEWIADSKRAIKVAPSTVKFHEARLDCFENELVAIEERAQAIMNPAIQP